MAEGQSDAVEAVQDTMKNAWEWTEADLLDLVRNQVQESLTLDYKASKALDVGERAKTEITKDVSALANAAGGTLVYGIAENKQTRAADRLDEGVDPTVITKEWLDQVISSGIQRRVDGIRINQIPLESLSPGRVAYVVHVPQSLRAPHQARDKLFYKRFEYRCVPMEEYEIRDLARRQEAPQLSIDFELRVEATPVHDRVPWRVILHNDSDVPCREAVVDLQFDGSLRFAHLGPISINIFGGADRDEGWRLPLAGCRLFWSAQDGISAFRDCPVAVSPHSFILDHSKMRDGAYLVNWRVMSPRSSPQEGWTYYSLHRAPNGLVRFGFHNEILTEAQALVVPETKWYAPGDQPIYHLDK